MTSFVRNRLAKTAMYGEINDVIRIHTDNVNFKTYKNDLMKNRKINPEDKTTGNLKFTVVQLDLVKRSITHCHTYLILWGLVSAIL